MGVGILAKRVVLELGSSTNFVYSLNFPTVFLLWGNFLPNSGKAFIESMKKVCYYL